MLFILLDGQPFPINKVEELKVKTVSCHITQGHLGNLRQLFSIKRKRRDEPSYFMIDLRSVIETQLLPGIYQKTLENRTKE